MPRPVTYYAELNIGGGRIIARLEDILRKKTKEWNVSRHTSTDFELHILTEGSAVIGFEQSEICLKKGHVALIVPNVPHTCRGGPDGLERFYFHFAVKGEQLKADLLSAIRDYGSYPLQEDTVNTTRELLRCLCNQEAYWQELLETMIPVLIIKVLRDVGFAVKNQGMSALDEDQERRNIIEVFFKANMPYGKREERLAQELGLSKRQLARVLQEYYGMNFREMLLHSRMEHATWMLRNSNDSIGVIAEKLKYTSVSAFSQTFRATYGMTPSQYRKENH